VACWFHWRARTSLVGRAFSVGLTELWVSSTIDFVKTTHVSSSLWWRRVGGSFRDFRVPGVRRYAIRVGSPSGGCTERQQELSVEIPLARCRSADRERARVLQVALFVALPANVGFQTSWCLCCTPLMGTAILVKRGSRL
jgi:hypothetical protein